MGSMEWSGARDLNPGPHGPESDGVPSNRADFSGFRFEISDPASALVQKRVNLRPNYCMKYYGLLPANQRPPWTTVDRPTMPAATFMCRRARGRCTPHPQTRSFDESQTPPDSKPAEVDEGTDVGRQNGHRRSRLTLGYGVRRAQSRALAASVNEVFP
jgi:hypothetical protein